VIPAGIVTRTVRGSVAELLNMEFVEALRAKGLSEAKVLRHVANIFAKTGVKRQQELLRLAAQIAPPIHENP
jgi:peptide/nickel transport system permease protein